MQKKITIMMTMQSTSTHSALHSTSTQSAPSSSSEVEDEIEVCNILLDLRALIRRFKFESAPELRSVWGNKKQRSKRNSIEQVSPASNCAASAFNSPPPPPPPPSEAPHGGDEIYTEPQKLKSEAAASPATPLLFSPSESDEKHKRSARKHAKKKSREELLRTIEELNQCNGTLARELENVMIYHKSLKDYNKRLKAKKEEEELLRISYNNRKEPNLELPTEFGPSRFMRQLGQMVQQHSSYDLGLTNNHLGPKGIPDLNLPAEQIFCGHVDSPQPPDHQRLWLESKARYAEARRNRKFKNSMKFRRASSLTSHWR